MRWTEITEKKIRKRDMSPEERMRHRTYGLAKAALFHLVSKDVGSVFKSLNVSQQGASSLTKRMLIGLLNLVQINNHDLEKISKQVNGAFTGMLKDHPEYGYDPVIHDSFVAILSELISNNFKNYRLAIEQSK